MAGQGTSGLHCCFCNPQLDTLQITVEWLFCHNCNERSRFNHSDIPVSGLKVFSERQRNFRGRAVAYEINAKIQVDTNRRKLSPGGTN